MIIVKTWLSFFLLIAITSSIYSQTEKKIITFDDAKLWRNHSVTLSDNGEWYTVLYSLIEKPEIGKSDKIKKESDENGYDKNDIAIYGKDAMTDVLYIRYSGSKKEYLVPMGARPKFSAKSNWIAYFILPEPKKDKKKEAKKIVELKNLETGLTKKWETDASFQFSEDGNYFITSDKTSFSVFDLSNSSEYYVANIGEFILPKDKNLVVYTIKSEDMRGNGIYVYNLQLRTTKALETGSYIYSNLSANFDKTALAALKYKNVAKDKNPETVNLIAIKNFNSEKKKIVEYDSTSIKGLPEDMILALNNMSWSKNNNRIFLTIQKKEEKVQKEDSTKSAQNKPTLDVWHGKDKKLVSQQRVEAKSKK